MVMRNRQAASFWLLDRLWYHTTFADYAFGTTMFGEMKTAPLTCGIVLWLQPDGEVDKCIMTGRAVFQFNLHHS
jgi:hypothetical protein